MVQLTCFLADSREGISFPNFVERSILKLPLSPSSVLWSSLYKTDHFKFRWRGEKGERVRRTGEEEGWPARGQYWEQTKSGSRKRGVEFKGGSRHDRNRHNRRNRQNRQNSRLPLGTVFSRRSNKRARCFAQPPKPSKQPKPS